MLNDLAQLLPKLLALARNAGEIILDYYQNSHQFPVTAKADATPLTQADLAAHEAIMLGLEQLNLQIPILSEEGREQHFSERAEWHYYWLVDPLDGTKEFLRHTGEFTINISLMERERPILGLIYAPVLDVAYYAILGQGAFKLDSHGTPTRLQTAAWRPAMTRVAVGHFYKLEKLQKFLSHLGEYEIISLGSALKFGLVAEGRADLYPRFGKTSAWDSAAGQLLVEEAGGSVMDLDFQPLRYNTQPSLLNPFFIAMGDPTNLLPILKIWSGENHG